MLVHIAGHVITVNAAMIRQRCAWCAEIIIDENLLDQDPPLGTAPRVPVGWPLGMYLTEVDGVWRPVSAPAGMFPQGCCVEIPPELTITYQPGESMFGK